MNVMKQIAEGAAQTPALDKVADTASGAIERVMGHDARSEAVEDALHGTWLGHPLHPPLTDLPVGAWALAGILDAVDIITGRDGSTATPAIQVGLLAALPTAMAGAMDWRHTDGDARRVGAGHAMLNGGAMTLYSASLLLRKRRPGLAKLLGFGGLGLIAVSGYLGGHLISQMGVGVKHESRSSAPSGETRVAFESVLAEDKPRRVEVDGFPLAVVRHNGRVFALADICPHLGCSLAEGRVEGDAIECACHGSRFALEDGKVLHGPSAFPVQAFGAAVVDGGITISPTLGERPETLMLPAAVQDHDRRDGLPEE